MLFKIIGILGLSLIIWGLRLKVKQQHERFAFFTIGGIGLLIYSIAIGDWVFIVLEIVFTIVSYQDFRKTKHRSFKKF